MVAELDQFVTVKIVKIESARVIILYFTVVLFSLSLLSGMMPSTPSYLWTVLTAWAAMQPQLATLVLEMVADMLIYLYFHL